MPTQVALVFMACVSQGLASRSNQFQLAMKGAPSPGPAPGPAPMGSPAAAPLGPCECRFEDFCTCGGALAYLDCISRTCAQEECNCGNNTNQFHTSCSNMANQCGMDLDIGCSGSHATCEGKFNQAKDGIIGLTMDFPGIQSEAFCGPTGRCTGTVQAAVKVHKPAKGVRLSCALEPRQGNSLVLQQSHSLRKPEDAKVEKTAAEKEVKEVEKVDKQEKKEGKKADKEGKEDKDKEGDKEGKEELAVGEQEHFGVTGLAAHEKGLLTCAQKVESEEAVCTMDMPPRLKPEGDIEGLCRLVDEASGEIITKDAWFQIKNAYTKPKAEPKPKAAEPQAKGGSAFVSTGFSVATAVFAAAMMI